MQHCACHVWPFYICVANVCGMCVCIQDLAIFPAWPLGICSPSTKSVYSFGHVKNELHLISCVTVSLCDIQHSGGYIHTLQLNVKIWAFTASAFMPYNIPLKWLCMWRMGGGREGKILFILLLPILLPLLLIGKLLWHVCVACMWLFWGNEMMMMIEGRRGLSGRIMWHVAAAWPANIYSVKMMTVIVLSTEGWPWYVCLSNFHLHHQKAQPKLYASPPSLPHLPATAPMERKECYILWTVACLPTMPVPNSCTWRRSSSSAARTL